MPLELLANSPPGNVCPWPAIPEPLESLALSDEQLQRVLRLHDLIEQIRAQIDGGTESVAEAMHSLRRIPATAEAISTDEIAAAVSQLHAHVGRLSERLQAAERELAREVAALQQECQANLTDSLTGLANRRVFQERLKELMDHGSPAGIVLCNLDQFAAVNDDYGIAAGDAVLMSFADVLRKNVRRNTLAARLGGDEFALLFPQASFEALARIGQRVRQALEQACPEHDGQSLPATVSVGGAMQMADEEPAELLKRVRRAVCASKLAGRNCCHVHAGTTIRQVASQRDPAHPLAPAAVGLRLASRVQLVSQIRRHLLESDLQTNHLSLVLLEVQCRQESRPQRLDLDDQSVQDMLWAICETVREEDLIAEYEPCRIAVLLVRATADAAEGPVERVRQAAFDSVARHAGKRLSLSLGIAQATAEDTSESLLQRAENQIDSAF